MPLRGTGQQLLIGLRLPGRGLFFQTGSALWLMPLDGDPPRQLTNGLASDQPHLAAVEQLRQQGQADARTAIAGKSYGGYLAAWAIGRCAGQEHALPHEGN